MPVYGVTVDGVKDRLVGLDGWLQAAAQSQRQYNDAKIARLIPAAIGEFMLMTNTLVSPMQICMASDGAFDGPDSYAAQNGIPIDRRASLPYYPQDAATNFRVTLPLTPVREIQRLRLMLGNQPIYEVPSNWFHVDPRSGEFHLIPIGGGSIKSYAGAWYAAAMLGVTGGGGYLPTPAVIAFDYIAGQPEGWESTPTGALLLLRLAEKVALQVLRDISELFDAGLLNSSTSTYGLTQQTNYSRFKERKAELEATIAAFEAKYTAVQGPGAILLGGL